MGGNRQKDGNRHMFGLPKSGNYSVGIYVRQSRDEKEENIETIETQRDLLVDFVEKNNIGIIHDIYMDDNVSGTGFDREGIKRLKEDALAGRINLVVIKDLSRLGRNNAKTLLFLDFLEECGVRVLTFDGRYDSLRDNDTVGIETWFNERYVRDISRKIRANLRFKIEKGEYIGHAPFGYKKSTEEKNRLVVDESTAFIVREIYRLYREGYGYACIARMLNEKGYESPGGRSSGWNPVAVRRILCNRVYVGDTVQGVSEKISFKSKKTRRLPQDKWVVTPNTHPAIISAEEFEEARRIREGRKSFSETHKGTINLFRGILFCGRCGSPMYARKRKGRPAGYICGSYAQKGSAACTSHYVDEGELAEIIREEIASMLKNKDAVNIAQKLMESGTWGRQDAELELERLEKQLLLKQRQQDTLYMDKLEGKISEQLFLRTNESLEAGITALRQEIGRLKAEMEAKLDFRGIEHIIEEYMGKYGLTNAVAKLMMERVTVFDRDDCLDSMGKGLSGKAADGAPGLAADAALEFLEKDGAVVIDFKSDKV